MINTFWAVKVRVEEPRFHYESPVLFKGNVIFLKLGHARCFPNLGVPETHMKERRQAQANLDIGQHGSARWFEPSPKRNLKGDFFRLEPILKSVDFCVPTVPI